MRDYNEYAALDANDPTAPIGPDVLGVVFTMVQFYANQPISALRPYMQQTRKLGVPVLSNMMRENKSFFGEAAQDGLPLILSQLPNTRDLVAELDALVNELETKIGL